jgi:hypothetical protein
MFHESPERARIGARRSRDGKSSGRHRLEQYLHESGPHALRANAVAQGTWVVIASKVDRAG